MNAYYITAGELAARGAGEIPPELQSSKNLIYSSPATLSFNSPGAQGFGVKRAGLAIPGSVMLLVAPGCCGRNTTILSRLGGYDERFFYLLMDDADIITGRHLPKITDAVKEVVESLSVKPSVVMICITCVDALLGTDMERVCRKASRAAGVPVLPCYMYALTREGRVPPMTAVRKTVYSLLEPRDKVPSTVNLLGEFAPFTDDSELYELLRSIGIRKINEISRLERYDEYLAMSEANFNLVLNPECRYAARDLTKRLGIPYIELRKLHQIDRIQHQYELFAAAIDVTLDDRVFREQAEQAMEAFREEWPDTIFSIGESLNGDPFEIALSMLRYGFRVADIFGTVSAENFIYVRKIAELSPDTRIFTNISPTMMFYDCAGRETNVTIGKDASFYRPDVPNVPWNQERQPFGYAAVRRLFEELKRARKEAAIR